MGTITINPTNRADYQLFINLAQRLKVSYTEDENDYKPTTKKEFLEGVERSVQQIKQHLRGEIELKNAFDLLDEI
jgi:hypothetical protein